MQIQEIRASAGIQWGCPSIGVMCTVIEVHGLQAELQCLHSEVYSYRNEKDRQRWIASMYDANTSVTLEKCEGPQKWFEHFAAQWRSAPSKWELSVFD